MRPRHGTGTQVRCLLCLAVLVLLSACASPEQQAAIRQQQIEEDAQQCRAYGLKPRTEAFANCRMQLDLARKQRHHYYQQEPVFRSGIYYGRWR